MKEPTIDLAEWHAQGKPLTVQESIAAATSALQRYWKEESERWWS